MSIFLGLVPAGDKNLAADAGFAQYAATAFSGVAARILDNPVDADCLAVRNQDRRARSLKDSVGMK